MNPNEALIKDVRDWINYTTHDKVRDILKMSVFVSLYRLSGQRGNCIGLIDAHHFVFST